MNPFKPSSELLHAYLDQQLDEPTRLAVEAYLASHPDAAAQVAGWRQDAQHLRAALANLAWGDNGGAAHGNAKPERQGDFGGLVGHGKSPGR